MTEMLPYAFISSFAIVFLLSIVFVTRNSRKSLSGIEQRLLSLEKGLERMEKALGEQSAGNSEEINLKNRQVKEEIRTALQTSIESLMKKVAENDSAHKNRIDSLSSQFAALQQKFLDEAAKPMKKAPAAPAKPQAPPVDDADAKAKRLARLIVSDIALYNRKNVEQGVRDGNFYELLEHDIKEAHSLYARRVPEEIQNATSYLEEAFRELVAKTKRELNL